MTRRRALVPVTAFVVVLGAFVIAVGAVPSADAKRPVRTSTTTSTTTPIVGDPVVLAAGDIASCSSSGDEATAALLNAQPNARDITLGDNAYENGSSTDYSNCYDPSWGARKSLTYPAPGNHDYNTSGATGYFGYFGAVAGDPKKGYYSYDLGTWHVISLNSNCSVVSCAAGSTQEQWLRADLAAHPATCTLAYWHHPRFSSGATHGSSTTVAPFWQALYDYHADLVLEGHEHNYERFAPLNPSGAVDNANGVTSFVVGTGGKSHYGFATPITGSITRNSTAFGVLQLTLKASTFDYLFLPVAGTTFTESGTQSCH